MKESRIFLLVLLFLTLYWLLAEDTPELRGVWMSPRHGNRIWSKSEIADAMKVVADHNFNTVYFNVWSRGWPLWRSNAFYKATGFYTEPAARERDILQEAILEAKKKWSCDRGMDGIWFCSLVVRV